MDGVGTPWRLQACDGIQVDQGQMLEDVVLHCTGPVKEAKLHTGSIYRHLHASQEQGDRGRMHGSDCVNCSAAENYWSPARAANAARTSNANMLCISSGGVQTMQKSPITLTEPSFLNLTAFGYPADLRCADHAEIPHH